MKTCRIYFTLLAAMAVSFAATAQQSVRGKVTGTDKKPVVSATVALLKKDSGIVRQVITDEKGQYILPGVDVDSILISITALGYQKYTGVIFTRSNPIQDIMLQAAHNELAAVTVSANKSFTEQKIDRTVVNVDAMISNTGATALEVLEKTPGVIVDENVGSLLKEKAVYW